MKKLYFFFIALSLVPPCFGEENDTNPENGKNVIHGFFDQLKEKNYSKAAEFFAPELLAVVSSLEFDSQIREVFQKGIPLKINPSGGLTMTQFMAPGDFQQILEVRKEKYPGGDLWECTGQHEKGKLLFRIALDETNRIAGYQLLPVFDESRDDFNYDYNIYYRGDALLRRLGYLCSLILETDQPENFRVSAKDLTVWQKVETKNGFRWREYYGPWSTVIPKDPDKQYQLIIDHMPPGNDYFIVATALRDSGQKLYCEGGPVSLSLEEPQKPLILPATHWVTLAITTVDQETGEFLPGTLLRNFHRKDNLAPSKGFFRDFSSDTTFVYKQTPPGTYVFEAVKPDNKRDQPYYVPDQKTYEVVVPNIQNGKTTMTVNFLRDTWNDERVVERFPFIVKGTVKTPDGTPIPGAKIMLTYFHHSAIRVRNYDDVGPEEYTDENGCFSFRFSSRDLAGRDAYSEFYQTNPEENWISISAKKEGFSNLPLIEKENYQPTADSRYENRFLQKPTIYSFVTVNPKPAPDDKKDPRLVAIESFSNSPSSDTPRLYPNEPCELEFILIPAVQVIGRIESDSDQANVRGGQIHLAGSAYSATIQEDGSFQVSVNPVKNGFFSMQTFGSHIPAVDCTPDFSLEKLGQYEAVLKWATLERNGAQVRKLTIVSLKDPDGEEVPLTETPRSTEQDFMFLRWKIKGEVCDDLGDLLPDMQVYLGENSERGGGIHLAKSVAPGEYETEYAPTLFSYDAAGKAFLPTTTVCIQVGEHAKSESFILSEENLNLEINVVVPRLAKVLSAKVLDEQGNPVDDAKYDLRLGTLGALQYQHGRLFYHQRISKGERYFEDIFPNTPLWFVVYDEIIGKNTYWNSEGFTLKPGENYTITLRLLPDENAKEKDAKILTIDKIVDPDGMDCTQELVIKRLPTSDRTVLRLTIDKIDHALDMFQKRYTIHATVVEQTAGKPAVKPGEKITFSVNDLNPLGVSIFLDDEEAEKKIDVEFESEFSQPYQGEIRRLTTVGQ